jgi:hypothetical protein
MKLIVAFHKLANVPNDEDLGWCTCLCGICNKAYFVTAQAQTLLEFWIQWVQVKGMLHNVAESVVVGRGPI